MSVEQRAAAPCFTVHVAGLGPFPRERIVFTLLLQVDCALFLAGVGRLVVVLSTLLIPLVVGRLRHRLTVASSGLEIRWAFFSRCVGFEVVLAAALTADPRRCVLGGRRAVLVVSRRSARSLVLIGRRAELEALRGALAAAGVRAW